MIEQTETTMRKKNKTDKQGFQEHEISLRFSSMNIDKHIEFQTKVLNRIESNQLDWRKRDSLIENKSNQWKI